MLQTCKHDTAKLNLSCSFLHFFGTVQYSHSEHLEGLYIDQFILYAS